MLTVFGDESYDERKERVFVVAGIGATQEEWDAFEPIWIKRTGGKLFHAADCEAGYGDFKNMPKGKRLKLYKDLVNLLGNTNFWGFACASDMNIFRKICPDSPRDILYYSCFVYVVLHFGFIAASLIPQQKAKFIFHQSKTTDFNAGLLYNSMINFPMVKFQSHFDEISFASLGKVGIQCADLFAREVMKDVDNRLFKEIRKHKRLSWERLQRSERFSYMYNDEEYFKMLRDKYIAEKGNNDEQTPVSKWLSKNKLDFNETNIIKYIIHKNLKIEENK